MSSYEIFTYTYLHYHPTKYFYFLLKHPTCNVISIQLRKSFFLFENKNALNKTINSTCFFLNYRDIMSTKETCAVISHVHYHFSKNHFTLTSKLTQSKYRRYLLTFRPIYIRLCTQRDSGSYTCYTKKNFRVGHYPQFTK